MAGKALLTEILNVRNLSGRHFLTLQDWFFPVLSEIRGSGIQHPEILSS